MEILCPPMHFRHILAHTYTHTFRHRHTQPYGPAGVCQLPLSRYKQTEAYSYLQATYRLLLLVCLSYIFTQIIVDIINLLFPFQPISFLSDS